MVGPDPLVEVIWRRRIVALRIAPFLIVIRTVPSSSSAPFPHRHPHRSLIVITGPDPVICHGTYIVRREMAGSSPAMTLTSWQPGCDGEGETATHPGHFA
jgi:hypothetical protein